MDDAWKRLLVLAESQFGVVSVTQAGAIGVPEHRLRYQAAHGRLEAVRPNVMRVVGSPGSWRQRVKAVTLWLGCVFTVSHPSAARLLRLDLSALIDEIHVSIVGTGARGRRAADVVVHRALTLPDRHRIFVDGIPCTAAARTVADVAGSVSDEELEAIAESARRLGLMTISELERAMRDCGPRRHGAAQLGRYLELHQGQSPLDHRLEIRAAAMLRRYRLSGYLPQHSVTVAPGRSYRVDFAWPAARLVVECDSFRFHGQRASWKRDRRRIAAIERAGWRVLIITWDDVTKHAVETAERIRLALASSR
jgi:very-short-patch-repair endonuclease